MSGDWLSLKSTFKYEPLNLDRPAFRLLRLKSARDPQTVIECELILADFDVEGVPDYEAISYTWGAASSPRKIRLNGTDFFVRFNLFSVLRDVRFQGEDRMLWVDALCIDQDNVRERGHQVQQMRQVYERAVRVIFWLGQPTLSSADILMDLLAELQRRTHGVIWSLGDHRWRSQWAEIPKGSLDDLRSAFQEMLAQPWFRRVWILQEVANARAGLVHWGHKSIPAKVFTLCPRLLDVEPDSHCQAVLDVMPGPFRKGSWWEQDRRLHTLLRKFSNTEAARDYDRIFALLGLCPEANARISVDYAMPIPQLLRETVLFILSFDTSSLDIEYLQRIGYLERIEHQYHSVADFIQDASLLHTRVLENLLQFTPIPAVDAFLLQFQDHIAITTGLCVAAIKKKESGERFMKKLLHLNPQAPQVEDRVAGTPLMVAVRHENEVLMRALIEHGADCRYPNGLHALYKASELGYQAVVQLLLDRGVSCDGSVALFGDTPLGIASAKGHEAILRHILNHEKIPAFGKALDSAGRFKREAIARLLVDHGATASRTAYGTAIENGNEVLTRLFLDRGVPATEQALHKACYRGHHGIARLLIDRGAPVTEFALEVACLGGCEAIVRLLIDRGAPVTEPALEKACYWGHRAIARLLLDQGVPATESALEKACWRGEGAIVRLLMDRGAPFVESMLRDACSRGDGDIFRALLSRCGSLENNKTWARDCLWVASQNGYKEIIIFLRSRGATNPEVPYTWGEWMEVQAARF